MKRFIFLFWIILCFALPVFAQEKKENQYAKIPAVNYCELIKNPNLYDDKTVKVFAEHISGFEHSMLGSQNCEEYYGKVWAEWEKYQSCGDVETTKLLINRAKGFENNYLEGNFVGKFLVKQPGASGFGHMNARTFKLVISCIESATLLPKEDAGCQRVDKTSPFHYLEYVKTEFAVAPNYKINSKTKKKEKVVWFRLVNNSSCSITVPVAVTESKELENNENVLVVFKLTTKKVNSGGGITFYKKPDKLVTNEKFGASTLNAGNAVLFAVPLRYFQKSYKVWGNTRDFWNISVPFKYTDRQAMENYDPFYFSQRNLPKNILKK
jgi:hypothetical protein